MLIDSHIHIGQYHERYFSPEQVDSLTKEVGIDFYAVSSTTQCEENYPKVLDEIEQLIHLGGKRILPMMWITPEGLKGNIAWYLESNIQWRAIKIHPYLNPDVWLPGNGRIEEVVDIARALKLPLLIHTSSAECCRSSLFESTIADNPDITFILAHGQPLNEATEIIRHYDNAFADSAFMPIDEMEAHMKADLAHKILWGTDMCIPLHFYPRENMAEYYRRKLQAFQEICDTEQFAQVTYRNAATIFAINDTY